MIGFVAASVLLSQSPGYPARPDLLPESEEIELARSAAPREISANATVFVLRAGGPVKAREGTNGVTCMVSRDLHAGSRYPICFDKEGSHTLLYQELLEVRLRMEGRTEDDVKRAVAVGYRNGALRAPARPAIAYMMSPHQVLFSSPLAEGRRVGAWNPHLMISVPNATEAQFGLPPNSSVDVLSLERSGEPMAQLIVKVQAWSDGTRVGALSANAPPAGGAAAREALRKTEQALAEAVKQEGFAKALAVAMAPDAMLLVEGVPVLKDRERTAQLLGAQRGLDGARLTWMPYRVVVSKDERLGATFGALLLELPSGTSVSGRYLSVWRKEAAGRWELAAYVHNGAWAGPVAAGDTLTRVYNLRPNPQDEFAKADRAFAQFAADSGAPAGFARFIAPDGVTFAGTGEINIGPANVRTRMSEGRAAQAAWRWWPVYSLIASSGDLGATVGEAEIRIPGEPTPITSKYLTIWQRQADGSLKFIADGGNGRPAAP
jgi:ketosteroid isomerase-like protein